MINRAAVGAAFLLSVAGSVRAQFPMYENFDRMTPQGVAPDLYGWYFINHSEPLGFTNWFQDAGIGPAPFASSGAIAADYHNTGAFGTISNWAITPVLYLDNGEALLFFTRTTFVPNFPDRLQVRMSTAGASINIGTGATDVGDFTQLLFEINPNYSNTGYPGNWAGVSVVISGLSGPTIGRLAFRYFVENAGSQAPNGNYIVIDEASFGPPPTLGVCCKPDGTCQPLASEGLCNSLGGVFHPIGATNCAAANCTPLASGACCAEDGGCTFVTSGTCAAAGGVYRGDNIACGTCIPYGFLEPSDVYGDPVTNPISSHLTQIRGRFSGGDDVDSYLVYICEPPAFTASTVFLAPGLDTQLFLFDIFGHGITKDDDNSLSAESYITGQFVPARGRYYLAISQHGTDPVAANGQLIWNPEANFGGTYPEWPPNGPAAGQPAVAWTSGPGFTSAYTIRLTGACFISTCYANCDDSSVPPILNANDFLCFLNEYVQAHPYANCDGSTSIPMFNANDFTCFIQRFAVGCT